MEIGSTARVSVLPAPFGDAQRAASAVQPDTLRADAVRTELPPQVTVRQPAPAAETEGRSAAAGPASFLDGSISVDLETRKVVFQEVDSRTGDVVMQIPDLRYLRAYAAQLKASEAAQDGAIERLA